MAYSKQMCRVYARRATLNISSVIGTDVDDVIFVIPRYKVRVVTKYIQSVNGSIIRTS